MAGVLDEFDDATPLRGTYCQRVSAAEYEEQGSACTEKALTELTKHLDSHPGQYRRAISRKRKQEAEEEGLLSFIKVKLQSMWSGEEAFAVTEKECNEKLDSLKSDMIRAFHYSEETKGKRFSRRLAEKQKKLKDTSTPTRPRRRGSKNVPPPPPPPPPPPLHKHKTPQTTAMLRRRPLSEYKGGVARSRLSRQQVCPSSTDVDAHRMMMRQLASSEGRKRLRATIEKSPGGTPIAGWQQHSDPDMLPYFNVKLLDKFKNVKSPITSPSTCMASPGSFESPLGCT